MILSFFTFLLLATEILASPSRLFRRQVDFDWGTDKVRGLNIGGWLVLEPWITPSIFEKVDQSLGIQDEFTLGEKLGQDAGYNILKPHWDTWVTLEDFQKIADAGFNTIRIPIGYWAYAIVPGEPYVQGAAPYLDLALDWARQTGLKVWIDLHGAPGSQNGFDNSGHKVSELMWQTGNNVATTLSVLKTITDKYGQPEYQDVVVGIELLNEPFSPRLDFNKVKQFHQDGYTQARRVSDTPVIFHDAFVPPQTWNGFLTASDNNSKNVVVDHHEYQVFVNDLIALDGPQHIQRVCSSTTAFAQGTDKWLVVGEWTAALTDCATWLNGYKTGARYDGSFSGSPRVGTCDDKRQISTWTQQYRDDLRNFLHAQLSAYEKQTQGWIFWNFKTEGAHEWDAFALLDAGIFPKPSERKPDSFCG